MEENTLQTKKGMKPWQADMCLVLITFCWGISYILMDLCTEELDAFTLNAFRFLIGGGVALLLGFKRVRTHLNKNNLKYGAFIGLSLVGTYAGATFGVQYTSISNSGFLCAMTVVFTPLFSILLKKIPERKTLISVLISFIGIALLTLNDDFSINMQNLKGDLLCLSCGFFYAMDLIITDKALEHDDVDPYTIGVVQLLVVGIVNILASFIFFTPQCPSNTKIWAATLFLALFCTGLAFVLQPIAQQYTTASRVGVIFTLEPVFNAFAAFIFLHEVLSVKSYIGAIIMIAALLFMEIDQKSIFKKKE